jgi:hypothetical protein
MVLGKINQLCAASIWLFGRQNVAKIGVIGRRWAMRKRRRVN